MEDKRDHQRPIHGYIVTRLDIMESIGPLTRHELDDYYMGRLQWQDAPKIVEYRAIHTAT